MAADYIRVVNRANAQTVQTIINRAKVVTIVKNGGGQFTVNMDGPTTVIVNLQDVANIIGGDAANL